MQPQLLPTITVPSKCISLYVFLHISKFFITNIDFGDNYIISIWWWTVIYELFWLHCNFWVNYGCNTNRTFTNYCKQFVRKWLAFPLQQIDSNKSNKKILSINHGRFTTGHSFIMCSIIVWFKEKKRTLDLLNKYYCLQMIRYNRRYLMAILANVTCTTQLNVLYIYYFWMCTHTLYGSR